MKTLIILWFILLLWKPEVALFPIQLASMIMSLIGSLLAIAAVFSPFILWALLMK